MKSAKLITMMAAVFGLLLAAASPPATGPEIPAHFQPFAFLVGGSWVGTFPNGKTTDEHRFVWVYDGQFIRDVHVVKGDGEPYHGESIYAWDAKNKKVIFWYWANSGGFSTGFFDVDGNKLQAREDYTGEQEMEMRSTWEKISDNQFDAHQYKLEDGEWKKIWTISYFRKE